MRCRRNNRGNSIYLSKHTHQLARRKNDRMLSVRVYPPKKGTSFRLMDFGWLLKYMVADAQAGVPVPKRFCSISSGDDGSTSEKKNDALYLHVQLYTLNQRARTQSRQDNITFRCYANGLMVGLVLLYPRTTWYIPGPRIHISSTARAHYREHPKCI